VLKGTRLCTGNHLGQGQTKPRTVGTDVLNYKLFNCILILPNLYFCVAITFIATNINKKEAEAYLPHEKKSVLICFTSVTSHI